MLTSQEESLQSLRDQHAQLKLQVQELESRPYLSEQDQLQLLNMKRQKLHIKDLLHGHEPQQQAHSANGQ